MAHKSSHVGLERAPALQGEEALSQAERAFLAAGVRGRVTNQLGGFSSSSPIGLIASLSNCHVSFSTETYFQGDRSCVSSSHFLSEREKYLKYLISGKHLGHICAMLWKISSAGNLYCVQRKTKSEVQNLPIGKIFYGINEK